MPTPPCGAPNRAPRRIRRVSVDGSKPLRAKGSRARSASGPPVYPPGTDELRTGTGGGRLAGSRGGAQPSLAERDCGAGGAGNRFAERAGGPGERREGATWSGDRRGQRPQASDVSGDRGGEAAE